MEFLTACARHLRAAMRGFRTARPGRGLSASNGKTLVFVGALTEPVSFYPGASGDGVVSLSLEPGTGRLERLHCCRDLLNPSFLTWAKGESRLYAAESDFKNPGRLFAIDFDAGGRLAVAGTAPLNGSVACHVCMLPGNSGVCVASYMDSCIDSFSLRNGTLTHSSTQRYSGSGPNAKRQEASHAHQALVDPAGRHLYVCDLGVDRIWIHQIAGSMPSDATVAASAPPGYGPRHLAFHPSLPLAYVICELTGRILTYSRDADSGLLTLVADLPGLPDGWDGDPSGAAIRVHPAGRALYASQRTHDSLAVYRLGPDGLPTALPHIPSGGRDPRDFDIDPTGRWIIIANQTSDSLVTCEVDPTTGMPTGRRPRRFSEASPVCVVCTDRLFQPRPQ